MLEKQGVDAIIAQGTEAGGHRGTFTGVDISLQPGLFALLPQVVDAVRVPVIAAGGVADGRTVAAAFVLGASAVQLGTAFLRCEEANVLDAHRAALREPTDACTLVTAMISGRPARYVKNGLIDDLVASELRPVPFPAQLSLTAPLGHGRQGTYRIVCRTVRGACQRHECWHVGRLSCRSDVRVPARLCAFLALHFTSPSSLAGAPISALVQTKFGYSPGRSATQHFKMTYSRARGRLPTTSALPRHRYRPPACLKGAKRRHGIASGNEKSSASVGCLFSHTRARLCKQMARYIENADARDRVDRPGVEPPL